MKDGISVEYGTKTILELRNLQSQGHLNLEPGFQRKSVWTITDRRKLIQSVLEGYPVPSVFLYRREENGIPVYDVIDGKQRLETIFLFSRIKPFHRDGFDVKFKFPEDDDGEWWNWKDIEKYERAASFLTYKLQVAEVSGPLAEIVDLFVRINSTGKALTTSERRHARFYTSTFLKEAERLARKCRDYFTSQGILSAADIDRMRDVELVCELLASILAGGPIHKKQAVDKAVGNTATHSASLTKAIGEFSATLGSLKLMFPELRTTRFKNSAEFYSLFLVIWELHQQKLVMTDRRRNQVAMRLLQRFSSGVDDVREQQRKALGANSNQRIYADYLLLVQQSTDAVTQRKRRGEMIQHLLEGLFERKDDKRIFSAEQRRLLWSSEEKKKCTICGELLDWTNFQADHIKAYSRGGKTDLSNAALTCGPCNASKGAGRKKKVS
ncbi:HNH endonuclease family protein [Schlesneria sp.]|uniref:HNH endonuclease family protein n=1 Tax=Schlesneria sp. TaxID=2762018 RepID=UPI002F137C18